jgi:hypothetical protein
VFSRPQRRTIKLFLLSVEGKAVAYANLLPNENENS